MVKLKHHPTRMEMQRLRERWDVEDAEQEITLTPFDTTLTSGINDTVQHLRTLRHDQRADAESNQLRFDAVEQLTKEAQFLRVALAGIVETLNRKASKRVIAKEFAEYASKLDKRIDNIFKLVAALGAILGVLIAYKGGHG